MSEEVKQRIAGHEWAEEVVAQVAQESPPYQNGFWREMIKHLPLKHKMQVLTRRPMSERESRAFGRRKVGFGKHADERWDEVPVDYLDWLMEQAEEQRAYVASLRVRREE